MGCLGVTKAGLSGLLGKYVIWCYLITWLASAATILISSGSLKMKQPMLTKTAGIAVQHAVSHWQQLRFTEEQAFKDEAKRIRGRPGADMGGCCFPYPFRRCFPCWPFDVWASEAPTQKLDRRCWKRFASAETIRIYETMRIQPLQSFPMGLSQNKDYLPTRWWAFGAVADLRCASSTVSLSQGKFPL